MKNNAKKWLAFRLKISSSGSPTYTVQGGAAILKPNTQKKIRIFAEEGQFSETDKAELFMFRDSEDLNLKSHVRAGQSEVKTILHNLEPTSTSEMHFELELKPKMQLAFPCEACEKGFAYREALLTHMKKKHKITQPSLHQCKYCDFKGAASLKALRAHERHHKQKDERKTAKFPCQTCEKEFGGEKQLSLHILRVHTEHLCRLGCGEKFSSKGDERKHFLNKHHKQSNLKSLETPPPCQICGKQYNWIQGLQKHLRKSRCGKELEEMKAERQDDKDVGGGEKDKEVDSVEKNKDEDSVQKERGVATVEMDKEVVSSQGGGEKSGGGGSEEKQSKGKGGRGRKRKAANENQKESKYEELRRANIKEREDFLASIDFDDL